MVTSLRSGYLFSFYLSIDPKISLVSPPSCFLQSFLYSSLLPIYLPLVFSTMLASSRFAVVLALVALASSAAAGHNNIHRHRRGQSLPKFKLSSSTDSDPPAPVNTKGNTTASRTSTSSTRSTPPGEYHVVDRWAGQDFFNGWDFYSNP